MRWALFLLIGGVYSVYSAPSGVECDAANQHYQCVGTSKCIPIAWLCDGRADCEHADDEAHAFCEPKGAIKDVFERGKCPPKQFECEDTFGQRKCIREEWRCDRKIDCKGGLDELDCTEWQKPEMMQVPPLEQPMTIECSTDQFQCTIIKECVNKSFVCDGRKNCMDNSDEANCTTDTASFSNSTGRPLKQKIIGKLSNMTRERNFSVSTLPVIAHRITNGNYSRVRSSTISGNLTRRIRPTLPSTTDNQTNWSFNSRVSRNDFGSTEVVPISPKLISPVSADGNKPQRIRRVWTSTETNYNDVSSFATTGLSRVKRNDDFVEEDKSDGSSLEFMYPQYKAAGDYRVFMPRL